MKSYKLKTMQDIFEAVNSDNVDGFLKDFESWLRLSVYTKEFSKHLPGLELKESVMTWNDDNDNGTLKSVTVTVEDKTVSKK